MITIALWAATAAQLLTLVFASPDCPTPAGATVAPEYTLQTVLSGVGDPRAIVFDGQGHLLIVEGKTGTVSAHTVTESNGCVTLTNAVTVVNAGFDLNYGIAIHGSILYASNADKVISWNYNATTQTASNPEILVSGMNTSGLAVRTLEIVQSEPPSILVSRKAAYDFDPNSTTIGGGTAQVRAFDLSNRNAAYEWHEGALIAWGVRNEVGLEQHPITKAIWSVEAGSDKVIRNGVDVSANNPADELNFLGYMNGTELEGQAECFGYPWCHSVWDVQALPNNQALSVGDQFAMDKVEDLGNEARTDEFCAGTRGPRLSFKAHDTPVDLVFNNSATELWVTFYGAWTDVGGKLSVVQFENGEPLAPVDSKTAVRDIVFGGNQRPLVMAFDLKGRIFMSAISGDIYLLTHVCM